MARKREVKREEINNEIPSRFSSCHRAFAVPRNGLWSRGGGYYVFSMAVLGRTGEVALQ